jgi:GT2 family glycosyltransferase
LDSDDYWGRNKLKHSISALNHDTDFVYHDLLIVDNNLSIVDTLYSRPLKYPYHRDLLKNGNAINCSSVVCKSSIFTNVGHFDTHNDCIAAEDFDMWIRIAKYGYKFKKISGELGYYRQHDSNISSFNKKFRYTKHIYKKHKNDIFLIGKFVPSWIIYNIVAFYIKRLISFIF